MPRPFNMIAGHPALDFANTLDDRYHPNGPVELIDSYQDLIRFCVQSSLLSESQERNILRYARAPLAEASLLLARRLRETIERVFSAIADGGV